MELVLISLKNVLEIIYLSSEYDSFSFISVYKKMKNLIFVLFLVFGLTISSTFAQFSDSEQSPYASAIAQLANRNIVKGYPDGTFKPQQAITRAELLKIILLAANVELSTAQESCFSDVPMEEWYADVVCSAKAMGIVK